MDRVLKVFISWGPHKNHSFSDFEIQCDLLEKYGANAATDITATTAASNATPASVNDYTQSRFKSRDRSFLTYLDHPTPSPQTPPPQTPPPPPSTLLPPTQTSTYRQNTVNHLSGIPFSRICLRQVYCSLSTFLPKSHYRHLEH
jgi:hypothetical protein